MVHEPGRRVGVVHHGFLNLVVATARAIRGGDVEHALADERPERVAAEAAAIDPPAAAATRALFVSYGSCDVGEPVADLLALGLLTAP